MRLLDRLREPEEGGGPHAESVAAGRVLDVLFASLGPVIGVAGVGAVFARSIQLSKAEYPSLGAFVTSSNELPRQKPEDVSERLVECLRNLEPAAARESAMGLFATFLRLLSSFVGEQLLWQIVNSALAVDDEAEVEERE